MVTQNIRMHTQEWSKILNSITLTQLIVLKRTRTTLRGVCNFKNKYAERLLFQATCCPLKIFKIVRLAFGQWAEPSYVASSYLRWGLAGNTGASYTGKPVFRNLPEIGNCSLRCLQENSRDNNYMDAKLGPWLQEGKTWGKGCSRTGLFRRCLNLRGRK